MHAEERMHGVGATISVNDHVQLLEVSEIKHLRTWRKEENW